MLTKIVTTIAASAPSIVAAIKEAHAAANPGDPPLTDAQVFAALHDWVQSTVAKDDAIAADIHARHPELPDVGGDVPGGGAV